MSFAVWSDKPPFTDADLASGEKIYEVGDKWVVTDGPAPTAQDVLSLEQAGLQQHLESAVQSHLDAKAEERGYEGILSAATYATSIDPKFSAEGVGYRNFRDSAWRYCYQQLAAVQAGKRAIPTDAELIAEIDANCPLILP